MKKINQKTGYTIKCYRVGNKALISSLKVSMLPSVKIKGDRAIISEKDSIVRVSNLNAFVD